MVWYPHLLKNFPQFVVIHTVKGFVNKTEVDIFLELSCFFDDPTSVLTYVYKNHLCLPLASADGEGNGTPLQYSCLENPMDGGAWKAEVHGVAEGRTRLSDFTFTFHFSLSCIGEGYGNPLWCSCLENPRDGASWWAAVYGVTQSRTRLK